MLVRENISPPTGGTEPDMQSGSGKMGVTKSGTMGRCTFGRKQKGIKVVG